MTGDGNNCDVVPGSWTQKLEANIRKKKFKSLAAYKPVKERFHTFPDSVESTESNSGAGEVGVKEAQTELFSELCWIPPLSAVTLLADDALKHDRI